MSNPSGFYHNEREERVNLGSKADYFDMNRDFPYNSSPG